MPQEFLLVVETQEQQSIKNVRGYNEEILVIASDKKFRDSSVATAN